MSATTLNCIDLRNVLYLAMELSTGKWVLAFSTGAARDPRIREINARDIIALKREIRLARKKFGLCDDALVVSCYEAGRDGFWLHRCLAKNEIQNVIIDSASIEQNRRRKQIKTDRIDAQKMVRMLCRWLGGESNVFRIVYVPSEEDEDRRHLHRELKTVKGDRNRVVNRIRALLAELGLNSRVRIDKDFNTYLDVVKLWNRKPIPDGALARLKRQYVRFERLEAEIAEIEKERRIRIRTEDSPQARQVRKVLGLRSIGETSAWLLVNELFGWRTFRSRRELGSYTGLVGAPFDSGGMDRDQGITKAVNKWVRSVIVEVAWMWLRYQPQSALSEWFFRRFGEASKRIRKIGIVALARKLIVALWRYLEKGIPPEGAILVPWHTKVGLRKAPQLAA